MNKELVIVDAGHGGMDSGAVGNGLEEKNLNLEASKYIYKRLQELGIPTVITRTEDEYLPKNARIERIKNLKGNNPNTILISNHINAGGAEGAEVVYSLKNRPDFANLILDNIGKRGQLKRKTYQRRLPEDPNQDYYYILRETATKEPVLIEYGFIDNTKDANKLKNNILSYAEGVVESIADYLGYPYNENAILNEYIVQKGDTLYSISKRFNISIEELKRINNLISNNLSIGQVLVLNKEDYPLNPNYVVQKGDTLFSIAQKNNVSIEDIIEINQLKSNILSIGQELYIPKEDPKENINTNEYDIYTVQKGDSLWLISQKFNTTVPNIIDINNLTDLTIQINQKLLVPKQEKIENTYIVKPGDTLWSISKKYNIPVDKLKEKNTLSSNLLSIGQELEI